jgi:Lrp/AsnC family leucine-responsive transcriptional regulator
LGSTGQRDDGEHIPGDYDYYIRIACMIRDYELLLRERLYRIPGIHHSKSSFVLRRLKESLMPLTGSSPGVPPVRGKSKRK